jgi:hypothetical protein
MVQVSIVILIASAYIIAYILGENQPIIFYINYITKPSAVSIEPVGGSSFAVVEFFALYPPGHGAERPAFPLFGVQALSRLPGQLFSGDKLLHFITSFQASPGHDSTFLPKNQEK